MIDPPSLSPTPDLEIHRDGVADSVPEVRFDFHVAIVED
jgi:hypothetical protein